MLKFTPEARAGIAARVAQGASFTDAAVAAGVRPETARTWLKRGRREDTGAYSEFTAAIEEARAAAEQRPEPMTVEEFREQVEQAVRAGSVAAMRLWADRWLDDEPAEPEQPASVISLLASRRSGRAS